MAVPFGGGVVDGHGLAAGGAERDREASRSTVPASPSVTVTSLIESVGAASLSVIVPRPLSSAIVALLGLREVDGEGLVDLVEEVAVDRHGDRLRRLAGRRRSACPLAAV